MTKQHIALIGNPNSGKSTLFNALTGARQKVGNWPGVTVEKKTGTFIHQQQEFAVTDLPGVYSLSKPADALSIDEKIALQFLLTEPFDLVLNIVDASNLERNLYLSTQLRELGLPMIIVLNMMDIVAKHGTVIDVKKLAATFNCPVVAIAASKDQGIYELKKQLCQPIQSKAAQICHYPAIIEEAISDLSQTWQQQVAPSSKVEPRYLALHLLENDHYVKQIATPTLLTTVNTWQERIQHALQDDADIIIADYRYQFINELVQAISKETQAQRPRLTSYIDNIVLNRWLGIPIFLSIMYAMFLFAINIGGAFQDFFDISSDTLFVQGISHGLASLHVPTWLIVILSSGLGKGINTTVTFIPVIAAMFFFLSFLESSGYMARAAFIVDRCMQWLGLPGKSFVPLIVGFGCNVPAIMAARTLENPRDRIITILMNPFMSCGARLAIYAVFIAAFFPKGGQNVVFSLYLIGILVAIMTGFILRKTLLRGDASPLIMEMPPYHLPTVKNLLLQTWTRLNKFIFKAGKVIIPVCILIGTLNSVSFNGHITTEGQNESSILITVGKTITPVFAPMGIKEENWPATVGLLTGVLAKEVVVASLNTLYSQAGDLNTKETAESFDWRAGLKEAVLTIPANLKALPDSLGNPILASAPTESLDNAVYGQMYTRFGGPIAAYAYLLFVLLYFPCISATAAMFRELNRQWTLFSLCWTTGLAYGVATFFYQAATFAEHPTSSLAWLIGIVATFCLTIVGMRFALDIPFKRYNKQKVCL